MKGPGPRFLKRIIQAAIVAGLLDAAAAMINYIINVPGGNPLKVWRFVASGALGPAILSRDLLPMALIGLLFHFCIAFLFAFFFRLLFARSGWIRNNLYLTGLLYGMFIWVIMNLVILPLSRVPVKSKIWMLKDGNLNFQFPADPKQLILGILILMFCVGLPIALIIGKHSKKSKP